VATGKTVSEMSELSATPELITGGENQYVEFKASLVWDYRRQMANKALYEPVMKNLVAFMNSVGGTLLIGVSDDGEVLGLDRDLSTLKKPNLDGFENLFNVAFGNMIGLEYRHYIDLSFPEIADKTICRISVAPANRPAYLNYKGSETFYIRAGNGSQPLPVSKATLYINDHFIEPTQNF
jgi:predicted HTH transcriptional regulator